MIGFYNSNLGTIQQALDYAILAISVQLVLRSGVFSLASVGFWSLGSYAAGLMSLHGWPGIPSILLVVLAGFVVGYLMSRPLSRLRGLQLAMATVAFDLVIPILAVGTSWTGGAVGLYGIPVRVTTLGIFISLLIVIYVVARAERGWIGRAHVALRQDEELAKSVGISVRRERDLVFALSAAIGALSGALYALTFYAVSPDISGFSLIVLVLTMVIIGGRDSWVGALVGAVLLTALPQMLTFVGQWRNLVYGVVSVVIILYAPEGLYGLVVKARRRFARQQRRSNASTPPSAVRDEKAPV